MCWTGFMNFCSHHSKPNSAQCITHVPAVWLCSRLNPYTNWTWSVWSSGPFSLANSQCTQNFTFNKSIVFCQKISDQICKYRYKNKSSTHTNKSTALASNSLPTENALIFMFLCDSLLISGLPKALEKESQLAKDYLIETERASEQESINLRMQASTMGIQKIFFAYPRIDPLFFLSWSQHHRLCRWFS